MIYTTIAYVPAIHAGYIKFFKKYPGNLFILGQSFIDSETSLIRDLRALNPPETRAAIKALNLFSHVSILEKDDIGKIQNLTHTIVMPDEEIIRDFASRYLKGKKILFDSIFLRWDKKISTTEDEVPADRTISTDERDRELIVKVHKEAQKSSDWWRQVGALAIQNGKIIFTAHNRHLPISQAPYIVGDPRSNFDAGERFDLSTALHAEASVIAQAACKGVPLRDASLYVTVFPCPVCAKLIAASGIKKVYYAKGYSLLDSEDIFKKHNIEIILVKAV